MYNPTHLVLYQRIINMKSYCIMHNVYYIHTCIILHTLYVISVYIKSYCIMHSVYYIHTCIILHTLYVISVYMKSYCIMYTIPARLESFYSVFYVYMRTCRIINTQCTLYAQSTCGVICTVCSVCVITNVCTVCVCWL